MHAITRAGMRRLLLHFSKLMAMLGPDAKSNETWTKHPKMTQRTTHVLKIAVFSSPAIRLASPEVDFGATLPKR